MLAVFIAARARHDRAAKQRGVLKGKVESIFTSEPGRVMVYCE